MINKEEAKVDALVAIADLVGLDYFRNHIEKACESYPTDDYDDVEWEYFVGFDDAEDNSDNWNVFVRVSVNRETEQVTFLDYRTPDGNRMDNPIKPISFA